MSRPSSRAGLLASPGKPKVLKSARSPPASPSATALGKRRAVFCDVVVEGMRQDEEGRWEMPPGQLEFRSKTLAPHQVCTGNIVERFLPLLGEEVPEMLESPAFSGESQLGIMSPTVQPVCSPALGLSLR